MCGCRLPGKQVNFVSQIIPLENQEIEDAIRNASTTFTKLTSISCQPGTQTYQIIMETIGSLFVDEPTATIETLNQRLDEVVSLMAELVELLPRKYLSSIDGSIWDDESKFPPPLSKESAKECPDTFERYREKTRVLAQRFRSLPSGKSLTFSMMLISVLIHFETSVFSTRLPEKLYKALKLAPETTVPLHAIWQEKGPDGVERFLFMRVLKGLLAYGLVFSIPLVYFELWTLLLILGVVVLFLIYKASRYPYFERLQSSFETMKQMLLLDHYLRTEEFSAREALHKVSQITYENRHVYPIELFELFADLASQETEE